MHFVNTSKVVFKLSRVFSATLGTQIEVIIEANDGTQGEVIFAQQSAV